MIGFTTLDYFNSALIVNISEQKKTVFRAWVLVCLSYSSCLLTDICQVNRTLWSNPET